MNISELILAIGDENVQFQPLDKCAISLDWSRKAGGRITFGTEQPIIPGEGTERMGIILWLDRKAVAGAMAKPPATPVLSDRVAELEAALRALQLQALQSPDLLSTEWGQEALELAAAALPKPPLTGGA